MLYKRGPGCSESAPAESKMETPKDFPGGLRSGDQIVIRGKLKGDSGSFQVTLYYEDRNTIPLHLEAEFGDTGLVLFRTRRNRQLEEKIEIDKFPSGKFEITIDVKDQHFEVAVNNQKPSGNFNHKDDFRPIKLLDVTGDVVLDQEPELIPKRTYFPGP